MNRATFTDDTTSGGINPTLRNERRVTVAAKAEFSLGFDWLEALKHDHLRPGVEAKSSSVLQMMDQDSRVREQVLSNVSSYPIIIVDLYESRNAALGEIVDDLRHVIPPGVDACHFVLQLTDRDSNAHNFVIQMMLDDSVLGRLENLLECLSRPMKNDSGTTGCGPSAYANVRLADRHELEAMNNRHLSNFLARLGAVIGDALSPQGLTEAFIQCRENRRYFDSGYVACQLLRREVEADKSLDDGHLPVMKHLEEADERIWRFANQQAERSLAEYVRRGQLTEQVSHAVLGLQAADIAAAFACREYERSQDDGRVQAVKRYFPHVLLEGKWV
jgi:hypothetical protein